MAGASRADLDEAAERPDDLFQEGASETTRPDDSERPDAKSHRDVLGTFHSPSGNVRTAPAARVRFELRLTNAQDAAWRAMAKSRGQSVADMLRAAVEAYATPEELLTLARPRVPSIAELQAEFRAVRTRGATTESSGQLPPGGGGAEIVRAPGTVEAEES